MNLRTALFWIALLTVPALAISLPIGWAFLQFHHSAPATVSPTLEKKHSAAANQPCCEIHQESYWEKLGSDPVGSATFLLCLVTSALAIYTALLYGSTKKIAGDAETASAAALLASTEATKLAREEFIATHRPKIMVQAIDVQDPGDATRCAAIDFLITNAGESVAIVTAYTIFGYAQGPQSDFRPGFREPPMRNPSGLVLAPGERISVRADPPEIQSQWDIFHADGRMFLLGRVEYKGSDDIGRVTGFCREYNRQTADWQAVPDSQHEYAY